LSAPSGSSAPPAARELEAAQAIGWVLRETGKKRPDLVHRWLEPRIGRASGVTVTHAASPNPRGNLGAIGSALTLGSRRH
jgi:DNA alkylation repair enzyme